MANTLKFKRGLLAGLPTAAEGEPLFTTDTADLYIGTSTGNQRFQKYIASGATTQILRGDGSLYTFPLNISSPSNGQVLKYNGTAWVNDSDAGITGSGASTNIAFFTGATTLGSSNNLLWDNANNRLNVNTGGATGSFTVNIRSSVAAILSLKGGSSTNQGGALYITNANNSSTLAAFGDSAAIAGGTPDLGAMIFTGASIPLQFYVNNGEKMRLHTTGNLSLGGTVSSDTGEKLQVTGTTKLGGLTTITASPTTLLNVISTGAAAYIGMGDSSGSFTYIGSDDGSFLVQTPGNSYSTKFLINPNGSVGIASTTLTAISLRVSKNITGAVSSVGILQDGQIQTDVTSAAAGFRNLLNIAASTTIGDYYHIRLGESTIGAGVTLSQQIGLYINDFANGTNRYGILSELSSGTGKWNLYCGGTAANYLNGQLLIGTTTTSSFPLDVNGIIRASTHVTATEFRLNNNAFQRIAKTDASGGFAGGYNLDYSSGGVVTHAATGAISGMRYETGGATIFFNNTSQAAGTTGSESMRIHATRNVSIGSGGDTGEKFQVTGTAKITGNLTVDTDTFHVESGTNRVGIGGTSPSGKLEIFGSLGNFRVLDSGAEVYFTRNNNNDIFANGGTSASLSIGGNSHVRFLTGSTLTEIARFTTNAFQFSDGINVVLNATTGTKFGTATSQKIGFWNAAPIVQPTTGVAAATRVPGGGATITDLDTFDGYTVNQIVKALRNTGLLA